MLPILIGTALTGVAVHYLFESNTFTAVLLLFGFLISLGFRKSPPTDKFTVSSPQTFAKTCKYCGCLLVSGKTCNSCGAENA